MVVPFHPHVVVGLVRDLATFATLARPGRAGMPDAPGEEHPHVVYEVNETCQECGVQIGDLVVYRPEKAESPLVLQRALPLTALAKMVEAGVVTLLEVIPSGASAAPASDAAPQGGARSRRRASPHLALVPSDQADDARPAKSS